MGYDLSNCNVNDDNFDKLNRDNLSDVVIVKKKYADKSVRNRRRKFRLRHLDENAMDRTSVNRDYTDFLEDLEEDPDFRQNIVCLLISSFSHNLYLTIYFVFLLRIFTRMLHGLPSKLLMKTSFLKSVFRRCWMICTLVMPSLKAELQSCFNHSQKMLHNNCNAFPTCIVIAFISDPIIQSLPENTFYFTTRQV